MIYIPCPKCGQKALSAPRFYVDEQGHESLLSTCPSCGYSQHTPCADAKHTALTKSDELIAEGFYPGPSLK